jgi:chemotaxis protein CheZ
MSTPPPAPLSEADYDAIESAVLETNRGRWFLAEYTRRNRNADTTMLLAALERIEDWVKSERGGVTQPSDRMRLDLVDMAQAIARTKAEIAAIKPDAEQHGKFGDATEELDAIVQATETATSDILASAEQIQEIAWTMREQGFDGEVCDLLDGKATDVYTACSFQDLTGQRTRKVIQVLRYLEGRINAMIGIWGLDGAMAAEAREAEQAKGDAALLNGPALPGQGLDQSDVDVVMGPAETAPVHRPAAAARVAEPPTPAVEPEPEVDTADTTPEPELHLEAEPVAEAEPEPELATDPEAEAALAAVAEAMAAIEPEVAAAAKPKPDEPKPEPEAATRTPEPIEPEPVAPPLQPADAMPAALARAEQRPLGRQQSDPLAAVAALSYEEKIALFT